jgi:tRNA(Ile)-lysidine synthase
MFLPKAVQTIRRHGMLAPGDRVVAAVSGGADSMALLQVLLDVRTRYRLHITVVHVDHMLRGKESRREALFVERWAREHGAACVVLSRDVRAFSERTRQSLQAAAREVRYAALEEAAAAAHAEKIALGHHADDQAETVLLWLLRGAGTAGLGGMAPVRQDRYIRPLLYHTRGAIETFCAERSIPFVPDTSVGELHYVRNRIRHRLIPLLRQEYNPQIADVLARTAEQLRSDEACLQALLRPALLEGLDEGNGRAVVAAGMLKGLDPALRSRAVRQIVSRLQPGSRQLTSRHVAAVARLCERTGPSRTVELPSGVTVRREYGALVFEVRRCPPAPFAYRFADIPGCATLPEIGATMFFEVEQAPDMARIAGNRDSCTAWFDCRKIVLPLTIRTWAPGDRLCPLGLSGHSKKVQDMFTDAKVPLSRRASVPVLLFGKEIAWVCGCRSDERFKVDQDTPAALRVWVEKRPDDF